MAARFERGWRKAVAVAAGTGEDLSHPSFAFDRAGRGLAAWGTCCPWLPVASQYTPDAGWSLPLPVTALPTPTWPSRRGLPWRLHPSVLMDEHGGGFVVWSQGDYARRGSYPGVPPRTVAAARYVLPEVVWPPAAQLSSDDSTRGFQVAASASGAAFVVWWESAGIMAARLDAGGGWTRTLLAPSSAWLPNIGVDDAGGAVAMWVSRPTVPLDVIVSQFRDGAWSPPEVVAQSADQWPHVAVGPGGDAAVFWKSHPTGELSVRRRPRGGGWQAPERIQTSAEPYLWPEAAISARGEILVAWMYQCVASICAVAAARYDPATGWSPEHVLASETTRTNTLSYPAVLPRDGGEGWVAWSRCQGDQATIMAARFLPGS